MYRIAEEQGIIEINKLEKQLRKILQGTIDSIEQIIKENSTKLSAVFLQSDITDVSMSLYGINVKSHLLLSGIIVSVVTGALGGGIGGAFAIGNTLLPVIGGIIGVVIGAAFGVISKLAGISNDRKKESLQRKIHKELTKNTPFIQTAIRDINIKYIGLTSMLNKCVNSILAEKKGIYKLLINNYDELKREYLSMRTNVESDIKTINALFPIIGAAMNKYLKDPD